MKANELMIGDYVSVKPSKMPIKIAAVHHKKVAYHACTNRLTWIRESLLEPIPLTLEILENNGFKKDEKREEMYYWNWGIGNSCVSYDKETGIVRIFHVFGHLVFVLPLSYVHQLQHALRLCGIEKTIEL